MSFRSISYRKLITIFVPRRCRKLGGCDEIFMKIKFEERAYPTAEGIFTPRFVGRG